MKKEILPLVTMLAIIIVAITGWYMYYDCKNNCNIPPKKNTIAINVDSTFCKQQWFKDIVDIVSASEQLKALKNYSYFLCGNKSYNECVLDVHTISSGDFTDFADVHPDNKPNVVYYNLKLSDLKSFIEKNKPSNCYDKHVNFKLVVDTSDSSKNSVSPELVSYDETKSCYSIPLLSGIVEKYSSTVTLKFCKARINNTERVIFSVDNNGVMVGYFDYTVKPMLDGPILSSF